MDLRAIGCDIVDSIGMAEDIIQMRAFVNTLISLQVL
jgi:hypothetical protein